jgi:hypothetical protein
MDTQQMVTLLLPQYHQAGWVDNVCNPNYLGGRDREDHSSSSTQAKKLARVHLNQ